MTKKMIFYSGSAGGVEHDLRTDSGREIAWIGPEGQVRTPKERKKETLYPGLFKAAGKVYTSWKGLCAKKGDGENLYYDVYGREVVYIAELFPCFDSYDYMNETRHYRWFFLKEDGKLTRVYHTDTRPTIEITEDVRYVENRCLEDLQKLGWVEKA